MCLQKVIKNAATIAAVLFFASFLAVGTARADLVGLSSSSPGSIYIFDPTTGEAIFSTQLLQDTSFVGLEYMGGMLYATDVMTDNGFAFGSIDMITGEFTPINNQDESLNWHGLAGNAGAGLFYTIDINDGNNLKSVDLSGAVTTIGAAGIDGRGMTYNPNNGILYATNSDGGLYTVDLLTGASTLVGPMGIPAISIGLAYDPIADMLYANSGDLAGLPGGLPFSLYTLDVTSGAATLIGLNNASFAGNGIDGLAFVGVQPIPEPASLFLLSTGLGALGLAALRRKKK